MTAFRSMMKPMRENFGELWRARWLLREFVARELYVRYKNSAFGFAWSIVPPLVQVLVYTFFVRSALGVRAENYSAYLLCGLIPWTFFSTATLDAAQSLLVNMPLIKKTYFPREVVPLAYVASNFVHFLLGWLVFAVIFYGVQRLPLRPEMLLFPLVTLDLLFFVIGTSLWMSCLSAFYEDVRFIFQTFVNLLLFVLPVLFMADNVYYSGLVQSCPWIYRLYMLNPVAAVINAYRHVLLEPLPRASLNLKGEPLGMDWGNFAVSFVLTVGFMLSGYWYFNRRKWEIVERHR